MAHQIYLISLLAARSQDDEVRDELAELIHHAGGFILMAAGADALVTAFDEQWLGAVRRHHAVAFCGAISLDPNGAAANKLRHLFAANVAAQLVERQAAATPEPAGPRHRPLVWHRPVFQSPANATGVSITTHPLARGQS